MMMFEVSEVLRTELEMLIKGFDQLKLNNRSSEKDFVDTFKPNSRWSNLDKKKVSLACHSSLLGAMLSSGKVKADSTRRMTS